MYTIKNTKIEDITCDGNGAQLKTRTNKRYYCLLAKDDRVITKIVHSFDDENFILIKETVVITKLYVQILMFT